jgi:hypothetical protein
VSIKTNGGNYAIQRAAPRFRIPLDIKWQPQAAPAAQPVVGRIRDISVCGFYFFSPTGQAIGSRLRFTVPFQHQEAGRTRSFLRGTGSVVRCENLTPAQEGGAFGIAVHIEEVTPEP